MEKVKLTEQEIDLISRGIRPELMDQDRFKALRSYSKRIDKEYGKGHFLYISKEIIVSDTDETTGEKIKPVKVVKTYKPFVRTSPKILGREAQAR